MNRSQTNQNKNTMNVNISRETVEKYWRPSIKVGYQSQRSGETSSIDTRLDLSHYANKKNRETDQNVAPRACAKKHISVSDHSAIFNSSVDCRSEYESKPNSKGMKVQTYCRYHASSLFSKSQANKDNESSLILQQSNRQVLPSYWDNGIKQILEYKHAKPYRNVNLTEKCNNVPATRRQVGFSELHEFDFRHRTQRF